jgi:hypothetical protein
MKTATLLALTIITLVLPIPALAQFGDSQRDFDNCVRGSWRTDRDRVRQEAWCARVQLEKQQIEVEKQRVEVEKQRLEYYQTLTESAAGPSESTAGPAAPRAPVTLPVVLSPQDSARRREEFQKERSGLLVNLRAKAPSLASAMEFSAFERPALDAETMMLSFTYRYSDIRDGSAPRFWARLEQTVQAVRDARGAWRAEVDQAARLDYLIAQRSEPVASRDAYSHPMVIESNIKNLRDAQARSVGSRKALVSAANAALSELTAE